MVGFVYFSQGESRQLAIAARIRALRWRVMLPTLVCILLRRGGLPVSQPVRLARLSAPGLDKTGQEGEGLSAKGSLESHLPVKDTTIPAGRQAVDTPNFRESRNPRVSAAALLDRQIQPGKPVTP